MCECVPQTRDRFRGGFPGRFQPGFPRRRQGWRSRPRQQAGILRSTDRRAQQACPPQAAHPPAGNGGPNAKALALAQWSGKKAGAIANAENIEYAGRILATASIERAKAVIGLALDPERNPSPGWCALVVSLRYGYDHWDHLLRAYNKSQAAARQERERAAKRREQEEEPEGGGSQEGKIFELED